MLLNGSNDYREVVDAASRIRSKGNRFESTLDRTFDNLKKADWLFRILFVQRLEDEDEFQMRLDPKMGSLHRTSKIVR
jgi:hypothetical protein